MSEQEKDKIEFNYNVDQQVSANSHFKTVIDGELVEVQITNRYKSSVEKIVATVQHNLEAYKELRKLYPMPVAVVPAAVPTEPTRVPIDDSGNALPEIKKALAGRLSFDVKNGKTYWKIMDAVYPSGEKSTKYGVTVWPEALKAAGFELKDGQPVPDLSGHPFEYICNEKGYPQKVTRILPR